MTSGKITAVTIVNEFRADLGKIMAVSQGGKEQTVKEF